MPHLILRIKPRLVLPNSRTEIPRLSLLLTTLTNSRLVHLNSLLDRLNLTTFNDLTEMIPFPGIPRVEVQALVSVNSMLLLRQDILQWVVLQQDKEQAHSMPIQLPRPQAASPEQLYPLEPPLDLRSGQIWLKERFPKRKPGCQKCPPMQSTDLALTRLET